MSTLEERELPVRVGDVIGGKYRVERIIGRGGMGVVVAALHLELDQRVALKLLLPFLAPSARGRFSREARAAARIKSEHVARVFDVGTLDSGVPFIVMEHLEGHDLGQLLQSQVPLPVTAAIDLVLEACEAIAEAHALGIIHRDLKPANLFLAERANGIRTVKVLDFGISKAMRNGWDDSAFAMSLTHSSDVFGSPRHMSPEQLRSSMNVDARTDIWGLGAVLFQLLAGEPPYSQRSVAEASAAIIGDAPAPHLSERRPDLPAALGEVVARCLRKNPEHRFASVPELARALAPFATAAGERSVERILPWEARGTEPASRRLAQSPEAPLRIEGVFQATELSERAIFTTGTAGGKNRNPAGAGFRELRVLGLLSTGLLLGGVAVIALHFFLRPAEAQGTPSGQAEPWQVSTTGQPIAASRAAPAASAAGPSSAGASSAAPAPVATDLAASDPELLPPFPARRSWAGAHPTSQAGATRTRSERPGGSQRKPLSTAPRRADSATGAQDSTSQKLSDRPHNLFDDRE